MEKIERKLNEYMEQEIAAKKHQSLTLGVFSNGFTGFYNFGSQNGMAVTENGFFEIASVSKIFTSILVLKLIKKGKINLDSFVEEYLPQF